MKTIEEAAQKQSLDFYNEIINNKNHFDCDNFDFKDLIHVANYAFKTAFLAGASFAQQWYDVNEILPENNCYYLCEREIEKTEFDNTGFCYDVLFFSSDIDWKFKGVRKFRPISIE